ncbi:MMPL family transporter, partial [Mycobacteroides sp. PCS013]
FIIVLTVIVVLLILVALLRAIVAPLYLIGSVIISYASAVGIGVIAFQFIGGQPLSWSVPGMAFIVLVAVGADYNLLFISRIRDESPDGIRSGVIKTVKSTGGVITSAGVIFAASMFGLLIGNLQSMVEAGFIIGMGLLLDTFLVRTITIPALVVLCGQANWWPSAIVEPWFQKHFSRSKVDDQDAATPELEEPECPSGDPIPEEPLISVSREAELAGRR